MTSSCSTSSFGIIGCKIRLIWRKSEFRVRNSNKFTVPKINSNTFFLTNKNRRDSKRPLNVNLIFDCIIRFINFTYLLLLLTFFPNRFKRIFSKFSCDYFANFTSSPLDFYYPRLPLYVIRVLSVVLVGGGRHAHNTTLPPHRWGGVDYKTIYPGTVRALEVRRIRKHG